ncbi:stage II sporulation protein M [Nocardioidaceae bacterium]|nr:stage II sporulation protein M [Nocardioidaceae bacterium]
MDLDAYVSARQPDWQRLEQLTARRRPSGAEADELIDLTRRVGTDLSLIRSRTPDATLVSYLSGILSRARLRAVGTSSVRTADVASFFWRRFPAALYRLRWWWLTAMGLSYALTALMVWWLLSNPVVETSFFDPAQVNQLVNSDFANYYSESAPSEFAAQVWTNNVWVAALCLGAGILGLPVVYVLWQNMSNLAIVASLMIGNDRGDVFFGLILPHGLLELTAVFVAAGVGLRVFWALVAPGPLPRGRAVAVEGRTAAGVALGLVLVLGVSGLVEGFVTPSGLPTWARIAIGVGVQVAFLAWVFVIGRRAHRAGHGGDIEADRLEDTVAVAA